MNADNDVKKGYNLIMTTPSLYGITLSNRNFFDPYYWGKNQFNSAFPLALACYMRSKNIPLVYVKYKDELKTEVTEIDVKDVFGSGLLCEDLYFAFESRYDHFKGFVHDDLPAIDLVVCERVRDKQIKPLEIKLTTLPDNTTEHLDESMYGTELVIRSATTRYMALSMAQSIKVKKNKLKVKDIFEPVFDNWLRHHRTYRYYNKLIPILNRPSVSIRQLPHHSIHYSDMELLIKTFHQQYKFVLSPY